MRILLACLSLLATGSHLDADPKDILEKFDTSAGDTRQMRKEDVAAIYNWLAHTTERNSHQLRGATGNQTFLHTDGHREAVYDAQGQLVQDGINDGSYNYAHPSKDPLNHFAVDILPWLVWGTSKTDPTSLDERLQGYLLDLGEGISAARKSRLRKVSVSKLTQTEIQVVALFLAALQYGDAKEILTAIKHDDHYFKAPAKISGDLYQGLKSIIEIKSE